MDIKSPAQGHIQLSPAWSWIPGPNTAPLPCAEGPTIRNRAKGPAHGEGLGSQVLAEDGLNPPLNHYPTSIFHTAFEKCHRFYSTSHWLRSAGTFPCAPQNRPGSGVSDLVLNVALPITSS